MRILVVGQVFYPDHFRINDIVTELAKKHTVKMVTGLPDYDLGYIPSEYKWFKRRKEQYNGATIIRVPMISRRNGAFFRSLNYLSFAINGSLYTLLLREKYDVVFSYQTSPITMFLPGLAYAKKNKVRSVLYTLDLWPESAKAMNIKETSKIFQILKRTSKKIYLAADQVIVSSPAFKQYLFDYFGIKKSEIVYLPQYTDEQNDCFDKREIKDNKHKIIQFTFAGNIGFMQDLETLVKAVEIVSDEYKFNINIVGSGSNEKNIETAVKMTKLEHRFSFYGRVDQDRMDQIYQMSDVCILTLKNNGYIGKTIPGKMQTYMAKGKPILAAISGDANRIINEAKCGLCAESGDYNILSRNIVNYIKHPELITEHSENSLYYYNRHFEKSIFMNKLENYLGGHINV